MDESSWRVETPGLTIEPAAQDDASELFELLMHPDLKFVIRPASFDALRAKFPRPESDPWWVLRTPDAHVVGLLHVQFDEGSAWLTLHVHPDHQRHTYGTTTLTECIAHLKPRWKIEAKIDRTNSGSRRLATKVGMRRRLPAYRPTGDLEIWIYDPPDDERSDAARGRVGA